MKFYFGLFLLLALSGCLNNQKVGLVDDTEVEKSSNSNYYKNRPEDSSRCYYCNMFDNIGIDRRLDIDSSFFIVYQNDFYSHKNKFLQTYKSKGGYFIKMGGYTFMDDWNLQRNILIQCDRTTFGSLKQRMFLISELEKKDFSGYYKHYFYYFGVNDSVGKLDLMDYNEVDNFFKFVNDTLVESYNWEPLEKAYNIEKY